MIEALRVLQKDKEKSKLIYGIKINKIFDEVRLDVLIDRVIAPEYNDYLIARLNVKPCKTDKIGKAGWNLPLEFVEEKYFDTVELTYKFKESE